RLAEMPEDYRQVRQPVEKAAVDEAQRMRRRFWRESPRCAHQLRMVLITAMVKRRPWMQVDRCPKRLGGFPKRKQFRVVQILSARRRYCIGVAINQGALELQARHTALKFL